MTVSELLKCLKALEEDGKGYYKVLFKGCDWFAEIHITHLDIPAEELILTARINGFAETGIICALPAQSR